MNSKPSVLPLVVGAVALFLFASGSFGPPSPVKPDKPAAECPNLIDAFKKTDDLAAARADAHSFATICRTFSEIVEVDGQSPKPRFTHAYQLDDFRMRLRQMRMKGVSFGSVYPDLPAVVDGFLTARLSTGKDESGKPVTSGGPLTEESRRKWIEAFRILAGCSDHASQSL